MKKQMNEQIVELPAMLPCHVSYDFKLSMGKISGVQIQLYICCEQADIEKIYYQLIPKSKQDPSFIRLIGQSLIGLSIEELNAMDRDDIDRFLENSNVPVSAEYVQFVSTFIQKFLDSYFNRFFT
ncbi:hypothetical protein PPYC1_06530 [Paenibacillus polymyxa]|nr:hypothetical protein PPYC1_06530 [Paenibacillus polymyxa]